MRYNKPSLTIEQQADLLLSRGLTGDRDLMITRLASVSYYRLSGYWFSFLRPDNSFQNDTKFEDIWQRYVFDRRLRLLIMDSVERIEVAVRSQLALHHSQLHGPFAYATKLSSMPSLSADQHKSFLENITVEASRSKEFFVKHFQAKYGDCHDNLPVWMSSEIMSFGCTLTFFKGSDPNVRKRVARLFAIQDVVLESWLLTLNTIRNICAHHGRLWNRLLRLKPKIPNKDHIWHRPVAISGERVFGILTICKHCLNRIAPQSQWPQRLHGLLSGSPNIPITEMGFPANWDNSPIWKPPAPQS